MTATMPAEAAEHSVPGAGVRVPAFDGVRGLAILLVLVYHTVGFWSTKSALDRGVAVGRSFGWLGVDLFFVLSGFLITGILIDTRDHPRRVRDFYGRRALRILPLFYGLVVVVAVILPVLAWLSPGRDPGVDSWTQHLWSRQLWLWTYTHNFLQANAEHALPGLGHLWSLAIEEQFYLVWPLVVFLIPRRWVLSAAAIGSVATIILRLVLLQQGAEPRAIRQWTFTRTDALLLGGVAAAVVRDPRIRRSVRSLLTPVIAGCVAVVLIVGIAIEGLNPDKDRVVPALVYPLAALGFAALMVKLCDLGAGTRTYRFWSAQWLRTLGFYSYALYVFHFPISRLVFTLVNRTGLRSKLLVNNTSLALSALQFVTVVALSLAAAMISWRLWEQRWLRLKRHFAYESTSPVVSPVVGKTEPAPVT